MDSITAAAEMIQLSSDITFNPGVSVIKYVVDLESPAMVEVSQKKKNKILYVNACSTDIQTVQMKLLLGIKGHERDAAWATVGERRRMGWEMAG